MCIMKITYKAPAVLMQPCPKHSCSLQMLSCSARKPTALAEGIFPVPSLADDATALTVTGPATTDPWKKKREGMACMCVRGKSEGVIIQKWLHVVSPCCP